MVKRIFDIVFSLSSLILLMPIIIVLWLFVSWNTRMNGFFKQVRVGQHGKLFTIYKLRTMDATKHVNIFSFWIRKSKFDELPQLFNVLLGNMSFVGPRPDIVGYYDQLKGEDRLILKLKPGITSEASIKYRNEEFILKNQNSPLEYNDNVIFPDKVKMNLEYYYNRSFFGDLKIIIKTFI